MSSTHFEKFGIHSINVNMIFYVDWTGYDDASSLDKRAVEITAAGGAKLTLPGQAAVSFRKWCDPSHFSEA